MIALTANGMQLSPDSHAYMNAAADVRGAGWFADSYTWWPPLYPLTLAPFSDPVSAARWLNAACYALTVTLTLHALRTRLHGAGMAILWVALMLAPPLQFVHRWVWSEPLFVTLCAAWFAVLLGGVNAWRRVILLGMIAALLGLQRYVGILFIPLGVGALLLYRVHWNRITVYAVVAFVPLALWMLRNISLGVPATGLDRGAAYNTLATGIYWSLLTLIAWLPVLTLACAVGWRYRVRFDARFAIVCAYYAVGHTAFIIWGAASTSMDTPNDRLLSPVFVPLMFCAVAHGEWLSRRKSPRIQASESGTGAEHPSPR